MGGPQRLLERVFELSGRVCSQFGRVVRAESRLGTYLAVAEASFDVLPSPTPLTAETL